MTEAAATAEVMEPTLWKKTGWIARVIKNDDDEGWAVEMIRVGDSEPALVGPWVMGRDKKNPKPMNAKDFSTLVKTANEVLERHVQAARAQGHKSITVSADDGRRIRVDIDLVADDDDPHALATCTDEGSGERLSRRRIPPGFKLSNSSALELTRQG